MKYMELYIFYLAFRLNVSYICTYCGEIEYAIHQYILVHNRMLFARTHTYTHTTASGREGRSANACSGAHTNPD